MYKMKRFVFLMLIFCSLAGYSQNKSIWQVGKADNSPNEFALAPNQFKAFIAHDFGYEDKFYLIGFSKEKENFPYVLPGPADTWGGTWPTSGWRTNQVNILFDVQNLSVNGEYKLEIKLSDYAKKFLPLIKVSVNNYDKLIQLEAPGYDVNKQAHPKLNESFIDTLSITGNLAAATPKTIEIPIAPSVIKKGGNRVTITVLQGSWILFDQIQMDGPKSVLSNPTKLFVRHVAAANYSLTQDGKEIQPLLINVEHLSGKPKLSVELDGKNVFNEIVESGNYEFEVPMPIVSTPIRSRYKILVDHKIVEEGVINRSKQKNQTPADYVDTRMGTSHSRWMIGPGPWMPFSMAKMSPDNQNSGWQAGYEPAYESIGTFSHIHEWTLGGLGVFPTNGTLKTTIGDELKPESGYRSRIDKKSEEAPIGYYKVLLKDYNIKAEVTSTTRCGFQKYTFPKDKADSRILVDLHVPSEYDYKLKEIFIKKVSKNRIEGYAHQLSSRVWSNDAD